MRYFIHSFAGMKFYREITQWRIQRAPKIEPIMIRDIEYFNSYNPNNLPR